MPAPTTAWRDDFKLSHNPSADFDLDSDVDGIDLLRLQRGLGTASGASISTGDANKDGAVDALDLTLWRELAFGPPFAATAAAIPTPEPVMGLQAIGMAAIFAFRQRGQRPC